MIRNLILLTMAAAALTGCGETCTSSLSNADGGEDAAQLCDRVHDKGLQTQNGAAFTGTDGQTYYVETYASDPEVFFGLWAGAPRPDGVKAADCTCK